MWTHWWALGINHKHLNSMDWDEIQIACIFWGVYFYYVYVEHTLNTSNMANFNMVQDRSETEFCKIAPDVTTSHGKASTAPTSPWSGSNSSMILGIKSFPIWPKIPGDNGKSSTDKWLTSPRVDEHFLTWNLVLQNCWFCVDVDVNWSWSSGTQTPKCVKRCSAVRKRKKMLPNRSKAGILEHYEATNFYFSSVATLGFQ